MQGEPKSPVIAGAPGTGAPASALEIFIVDLAPAATHLEAEEARTPRLSAADIDRANAMPDNEARSLWRASRIATRLTLERMGGAGLRQVPFQIEPGGRPILGEGNPCFSVSHTRSVALIGVANAMALGVDIEARTRALKMSPDRKRRIVAAAGRLGGQVSLSAEKDGDVLTAWVQLEAAAKALGIGIGRLLTLEGVVGGSTPHPSNWQDEFEVRAIAIAESYIAGIAAPRIPAELAIRPFPYTQIDAFLRGQ